MIRISEQTQNNMAERRKYIDITSNDNQWTSKIELTKPEWDNLYITSGSVGNFDKYISALPDKLNIFKKWHEIDVIGNQNVKKQTEKFFKHFQYLLFVNKDKLNAIGSLPILAINLIDDNSMLVEWIFKDFRIGFSFEDNENDSSWYLASNQKFSDASASGSIKENELDDLLLNILAFVSSNV
jgi:hypothetical protein